MCREHLFIIVASDYEEERYCERCHKYQHWVRGAWRWIRRPDLKREMAIPTCDSLTDPRGDALKPNATRPIGTEKRPK